MEEFSLTTTRKEGSINSDWPPSCHRCKKKLEEPGALAFAPPYAVTPEGERRLTSKFHICTKCWSDFINWLHGDLE